MQILPQLILVIVLIFLNGFFVASEFALVAVRKTRIDELAKTGNFSARLVQKALDNLDTFISATQLGITIASLALGWIGEPAIASLLEPIFHNFLPNNAAVISSHSVAFTIAFSIITFLHIVIGELAPKTIALQKTERTSLFIIAPLSLFATIFKPFIWFLNEAGLLVLRLFGFTALSGRQLAHSEEEIKTILRQSAEEGVIKKEKADMVSSVLKLGDLPIEQIMVPRTDIVAFDINTPLSKVLKTTEENLHSRFPVYKDSIDNIVGFIHIKDIYRHALSDPKLKIVEGIYKTFLRKDEGIKISQTKLMRNVLIVPESKKIDKVLLDMRRQRVHMAVVNDEYGGTAGIATMEDAIESLVGEIQDEFEEPYKEIQLQKDGTYLIDGFTSIDAVKSKFKLPVKKEGYTTIGGLLFGLLGHNPKMGEKITIGEKTFEILEIRKNRINKILLHLQVDSKAS